MTETTRSQADQETIDKMKSDGKIIAVQLIKLTAVVSAGIFIYKKLKAVPTQDIETENTDEN
jgi:hypothetical protein